MPEISQRIARKFWARNQEVSIEGYAKKGRFIPNGVINAFSKSGSRTLLGRYAHGKPDGRWIGFYEDGTKRFDQFFVFGRLNGTCTNYWDNGTIARTSKHDFKTRSYVAELFDREGAKIKTKAYSNGALVYYAEAVRGENGIASDSARILFDAEREHLSLSKPIRHKRICHLDQRGELHCRTPYQLWCFITRVIPVDDAVAIMERLAEYHDILKSEDDDDLLVNCGGQFLNMKSSQSSKARPSKSRNRLKLDPGFSTTSDRELEQVSAACEAAVRQAIKNRGISSDQSVRDAVAHIDAVIGSCRDSDTSGIEFASPIVVALIVTIGALGSALAVLAASKNAERGQIAASANAARGQIRASEVTAAAMITVARLNLQAAQLKANSNNDDKEKGDATEEEDATVDLDTDDPIDVEDDPEAIVTIVWDEVEVTSGPPSTQQPDENRRGSSCAEKEAWWSRRREFCDDVNWQTYGCQEVLRVFSGCADPALVTPTPDGTGVVCPQDSGMTDAEFRQLECRRKSGIMMPSGLGTDLCTPLEDFVISAPDVCLDPHAHCVADWSVPGEGVGPKGFMNARRDRALSNNLPRRFTLGRSLAEQRVSHSVPSIDGGKFHEIMSDRSGTCHFVVFASEHCAPCHKVLDVFSIEGRMLPGASYHKVDVVQHKDLAENLAIQYTPTIVAFRNGALVGQRRVGAARRELLVAYLERTAALTHPKAPEGDALGPPAQ